MGISIADCRDFKSKFEFEIAISVFTSGPIRGILYIPGISRGFNHGGVLWMMKRCRS